MSAQFQVPIGIVPISLQTLFVLCAGGILGRKGAIAMVIYLFMGLVGLPVFAGGKGGTGVLMGPTGGYIIEFIFAAYVAGFLIERKKNILASMFIATFVIYIFGLLGLSFFVRGIKNAFLIGMAPFMIGGIVKAFGAYLITKEVRKYYSQIS
ncbi:MAG: biotin transporter BioY [Methanomicrobia archaeon]|nr:biotin transporter BioY [Methanomicrobia archaeon]